MGKTMQWAPTESSSCRIVGLRWGRPLRLRVVEWGCVVFACALAASLPLPASANGPKVTIVEKQPLRFGKFAVLDGGRRTINADGSIKDSGLIPAGLSNVGPASFIVSYDRGTASKKPIDIALEIFVSSGVGGRSNVDSKLSDFTTDIPNSRTIKQGQAIKLEMKNCRSRVCTATFSMGATLSVSRANRGSTISIPTYVDLHVRNLH